MYNGVIEGIFKEEGSFDIESDIIPFLSTLKGFKFGFNSGMRAEVLFPLHKKLIKNSNYTFLNIINFINLLYTGNGDMNKYSQMAMADSLEKGGGRSNIAGDMMSMQMGMAIGQQMMNNMNQANTASGMPQAGTAQTGNGPKYLASERCYLFHTLFHLSCSFICKCNCKYIIWCNIAVLNKIGNPVRKHACFAGKYISFDMCKNS